MRKLLLGLVVMVFVSCTSTYSEKGLRNKAQDYCECVKDAREYSNSTRRTREVVKCNEMIVGIYGRISRAGERQDLADSEVRRLREVFDEELNRCR